VVYRVRWVWLFVVNHKDLRRLAVSPNIFPSTFGHGVKYPKLENRTRLSTRHRQALELALEGRPIKQIAEVVNSDQRVVASWFARHPVIRQLLNQQLDADAMVATIRANQLLAGATGVCAQMMGADNDPKTRLAAASLAIAIHRQVAGSAQQARLLQETEQLRSQLAAVLHPGGEVIDVEAALDPLLAECRALPSAAP
jgi:hypothetical protein